MALALTDALSAHAHNSARLLVQSSLFQCMDFDDSFFELEKGEEEEEGKRQCDGGKRQGRKERKQSKYTAKICTREVRKLCVVDHHVDQVSALSWVRM